MDCAGPLPGLPLVSKLQDEMGPRESLSVTPHRTFRRQRLSEQHDASRWRVLAGYPLQDDAFHSGSATEPPGFIVVSAAHHHAGTRSDPHHPSLSGSE